MKDLSKSALNILGILFAGLLLAYTGYQTFSLLLEVSGSPLIAAIGLIMFEVGMLYWWQVFRVSAEGLMQMALSFLVFLACLTFVVMATALKLGAVDAAVLGVNTPAKIITAAAVIQLAAKLFFPILHPETMRVIGERVQEGKILNAANDKFEKRVDGIAREVADGMVEEWTGRLTTNFNTKYGTRYELSPGRAPAVIEGHMSEAVDVSPRRSWRDRLRGRPAAAPMSQAQAEALSPNELVTAVFAAVERGEISLAAVEDAIKRGQRADAAMRNSTHDTEPAIIPLAQPAPGQGQGNGPAAKLGADTRNPTSRP